MVELKNLLPGIPHIAAEKLVATVSGEQSSQFPGRAPFLAQKKAGTADELPNGWS